VGTGITRGMNATLSFFNYYRSAQISITKRFIEQTLGLVVMKMGVTLIVDLNGYNKEDFVKNLKPYMNYGVGGIEEITF
jgi:hypothetical protein